ncbi:MAG: CobW family GTP-binding protein [Gammaproteobacteria bacterium]
MIVGGEQRIPITLLTGFLGSGKTTVLNGLLRHPQLRNTAVVVNEFGEIGLDHLLVRSADENVVLLDAGCLCCTINNTLRETLGDLWLGRVRKELPAFDRVLIETTGLAEPGPILQAITNDPFVTDHYRLDGVVACVDALHALDQLDEQPEAAHQVAVADRLLLTKTDVVSERQREAVADRMASLNPAAAIVSAVHGNVAPEQVLDIGLYDGSHGSPNVERWLNAQGYDANVEDRPGAPALAHAHDKSRHGEHICSHCFYIDHAVSWAGLAAWCDLMAEAHGDALLRVKGIIEITETGKPVVVHGVHEVFDPPVRLDNWPGKDRRSRLVVISRDLDERILSRSLAALRLAPGSGRPASLAELATTEHD